MGFDDSSPVYLEDVEWTDDGLIYFIREQGFDGHPELWRKRADGAATKMLAEVPRVCDVGRGYLEFVTTSSAGQPAVGVSCSDGRTTVYAFDATTKRVTPLVALEDARRVTIGPRPDDGYMLQGAHPCTRVMPFRAGALVESDLSVQAAAGSWRLRDGYNGTPDCASAGDVGVPVWSRRGGFVAFLVSSTPLTAGRKPGMSSDGYVWNVAVIRDQSSTVDLVGPAITDANALAVSPDATQMAVGTEESILLIDVRTGVSRPVPGEAGAYDLAFSPDGRQLLCTGTDKKSMRTIAVA
ncbi:hypothetical protein [Dactylosporangium cerinum]